MLMYIFLLIVNFNMEKRPVMKTMRYIMGNVIRLTNRSFASTSTILF